MYPKIVRVVIVEVPDRKDFQWEAIVYGARTYTIHARTMDSLLKKLTENEQVNRG